MLPVDALRPTRSEAFVPKFHQRGTFRRKVSVPFALSGCRTRVTIVGAPAPRGPVGGTAPGNNSSGRDAIARTTARITSPRPWPGRDNMRGVPCWNPR